MAHLASPQRPSQLLLLLLLHVLCFSLPSQLLQPHGQSIPCMLKCLSPLATPLAVHPQTSSLQAAGPQVLHSHELPTGAPACSLEGAEVKHSQETRVLSEPLILCSLTVLLHLCWLVQTQAGVGEEVVGLGPGGSWGLGLWIEAA